MIKKPFSIDSSVQPALETKTEGSAIFEVTLPTNKTDGQTHVLESSPSSTVYLAPLQHPQEVSTAPSCLSLLHKLCVGPANSNRVGTANSNRVAPANSDRVNRKVEKDVVLNKNTAKSSENISNNGSINKEKNNNDKNENGMERSDMEKRKDEKEYENVSLKIDKKDMIMIENDETKEEETCASVNTASLSSDSIEISFSHSQIELIGNSSKNEKSPANHISDDLSDIHENNPISVRDLPPVSDCEISQKIGFIKQLEFIHKLTDLVEKLRFVDRPLRGDALIKGLKKLNEKPSELGK